MSTNKIAVLGGGAFGIALSKIAAETSEVKLWARNVDVCLHINKFHHHPHKLTNILLPPQVVAESDLKTALSGVSVVILALPMHALREVLTSAKDLFEKNAILVSCAKGIEEESLLLASDIIAQSLPKTLSDKSCYLSGPSFAIELALGLPTALTLASLDKKACEFVQKKLSRNYCRIYRSDDVVGVCVGGALKNVIAIAAGACMSLRLGRNALASLITRGLFEIMRLALAMGGKVETISGLSGAGDLILSSTDDMSRNHRLGALMADGLSREQALQSIGSVVEGAKTASSIPKLMKKYQIDLPISHSVYQFLYENISAKDVIAALLARELKDEV
jgi:glycerol-3-phosphate dehydrogenase (NAD(P)+)